MVLQAPHRSEHTHVCLKMVQITTTIIAPGDAPRAALQAPHRFDHTRVCLKMVANHNSYCLLLLPLPTELLSLTSLGDAPRAALQALQAAYTAAVLAFDKDSEQPRSTGVAIFFPMQVGLLLVQGGW